MTPRTRPDCVAKVCTLQRACSYCYYVFCALYRKSWFLSLVNIRTEGIHAVCVCACVRACMSVCVCVLRSSLSHADRDRHQNQNQQCPHLLRSCNCNTTKTITTKATVTLFIVRFIQSRFGASLHIYPRKPPQPPDEFLTLVYCI